MDICENIDSPHSQSIASLQEAYLNEITSDESKPLIVQGQDSHKESYQSDMTNSVSKKILSKSSTFPSPNKISPSNREADAKEGVAVDMNPKSATPPCQRSISMPVSAFSL